MGLFSSIVKAVTSPIRAVFGGDDRVEVHTTSRPSTTMRVPVNVDVSTTIDTKQLGEAIGKAILQAEYLGQQAETQREYLSQQLENQRVNAIIQKLGKGFSKLGAIGLLIGLYYFSRRK